MYLLCAAVCGAITIFLLLYFLASISDNAKLADCISICKAVLAKRFMMCLAPILYIGLLFVHFIISALILALVMFSGEYNSQLNFIEFSYMSSDFIVKTDIKKIITMVIACFYLVHGIFFYYSCLQYVISNLSYTWYNDRIALEYKDERKAYIDGALNANTPRIRSAVDKARKENKKSFKDGRIDQSAINVGMKKAYTTTNKNTFKNLGTIFYYSFVQVFVFIPRIFLNFIHYIQTKTALG